MKVEHVSIDSVKLDENNARGHEKGIKELANSLAKFGQRKPIVVWQGTVIAGNGTVEAAKSLGWTKIDIVRAPEEWDYDTARAFALADNKTAELSEWKLPVLEQTMLELDGKDWDLEAFGFDPLPTLVNFGDTDPDDVPDVPEVPKTKFGDLWQLGDHLVLCGDSTKAESYSRLMGSSLADCVWTDPPYGVDYVGKTKKALTIQNDGSGGLKELLGGSFCCWSDVCIAGAAVYIAHPAGALSLTFLESFIAQGWRLHETLCWNKQTIVVGHSDYHYSHEPILFGYMIGGGASW